MNQERKVNQGPRCRSKECRQTEARCAWRGQCCPDCSHFGGLDARGNDTADGTPGRKPLPQEHGTGRGWEQHRTRGELPCGACRLAHNRAVAWRKARRSA